MEFDSENETLTGRQYSGKHFNLHTQIYSRMMLVKYHVFTSDVQNIILGEVACSAQ